MASLNEVDFAKEKLIKEKHRLGLGGSRIIGLGICQMKSCKKRRILVGFPLSWRGIAYILCPVVSLILLFGSCSMIENTNNNQVKEEANQVK